MIYNPRIFRIYFITLFVFVLFFSRKTYACFSLLSVPFVGLNKLYEWIFPIDNFHIGCALHSISYKRDTNYRVLIVDSNRDGVTRHTWEKETLNISSFFFGKKKEETLDNFYIFSNAMNVEVCDREKVQVRKNTCYTCIFHLFLSCKKKNHYRYERDELKCCTHTRALCTLI